MPSKESAAQDVRITVKPSDVSFAAHCGETILAAALRAEVLLPHGCQDGACGSCKCKKLSGEVVQGAHQSKALSALEQEQGWVLTCCAVASTDVLLESHQVTTSAAIRVRKMPARVRSMQRASHDVMLLGLQLPANDNFVYRAGQYVDVMLNDGSKRSYSMSNAPGTGATNTLAFHVRHRPGGKFTDVLFGTMKEKDMVRIEGPYGSFFLREDSDKPIIFLASGTGLAPIKAIIEHMHANGTARCATLYWGGCRPHDLYLEPWIRQQLAAMPQLRYVPVVSEPLAQDIWRGRTGFVHQAVLEDFADLSKYQVYACGAPVVIEAARSAYLQAGLPAHEFYADAFTTEADSAAARAASAC